MAVVEAAQADRLFEVKSPLGKDVLLFHAMSANERLSHPFKVDLELLSKNHDIELDDVVGNLLTVRLDMPAEGKTRFFNGYVSQFSYEGNVREFSRYHATLRPWFWLLTRKADCRIFQEKTVPEIIEQIFQDDGFSDFEKRLSGEYRTWEYCVQYRETDFNFVSRLMEQEGIYYYFKHEDGKHTMVLSDSVSAHDPIPDYEKVPYYPPSESGRRERDHLSAWSVRKQVEPGKYSLRDFDFEKPGADLETRSNNPLNHAQKDFEVYDYPGEYVESGEGETYARIRLEELQSQHERVSGGGNVAGLFAGGLFALTGFPREDQNREYLVTSSTVELSSEAYLSGKGGGESACRCSIVALDSKTPYRAPRATAKPVVQGPQTAIVVGPSGEEIYTDKYGRVKVQFHWDREGKDDENSSCWIRVSYPWAGKNWGGVHIPRMGQEVIVDFLEGDPDRPIITGRVYNAESVVPYSLPDNMTQSGIKSRSSKGGSGDNFNEIRFEDKKGEEQVYIHAEKNQDNVVENDETTNVGHDRTEEVGNDEKITIGNDRTEDVGNDEKITIGNNRTENVGKDESITIGNNRTENVGNDESITIGSNRTENVGKDESITIGSNRTENVGADESITIGASRTENVGSDEKITIGSNRTESVGSDESVSIGGSRSQNVGKDESVSIGAGRSASVGNDDSLSVGKSLSASAGDQIALNTGSASIIMKKNGDITINGKNITIKGSGNVVIKGSKILEN